MQITANTPAEEFIFEIEKDDFRKLQLIFTYAIGGKIRQDKDDSLWLRLPNTINKDERDELAKFLLHPEENGKLNPDEVFVVKKYNRRANEDVLNVIEQLNLDTTKYLEIWNNFTTFATNSVRDQTEWSFK